MILTEIHRRLNDPRLEQIMLERFLEEHRDDPSIIAYRERHRPPPPPPPPPPRPPSPRPPSPLPSDDSDAEVISEPELETESAPVPAPRPRPDPRPELILDEDDAIIQRLLTLYIMDSANPSRARDPTRFRRLSQNILETVPDPERRREIYRRFLERRREIPSRPTSRAPTRSTSPTRHFIDEGDIESEPEPLSISDSIDELTHRRVNRSRRESPTRRPRPLPPTLPPEQQIRAAPPPPAPIPTSGIINLPPPMPRPIVPTPPIAAPPRVPTPPPASSIPHYVSTSTSSSDSPQIPPVAPMIPACSSIS